MLLLKKSTHYNIVPIIKTRKTITANYIIKGSNISHKHIEITITTEYYITYLFLILHVNNEYRTKQHTLQTLKLTIQYLHCNKLLTQQLKHSIQT